MKKTLLYVGISIVAVGFLAGTVSAANNPIKPKLGVASTTASTTIRKAAKLDQANAKLQDRANKEIDRRLTALNKLQSKIQETTRISPTDKSSLTTTIQAQINLLNNLKVKIGADTDAVTLKADIQSITRAYRIYALILPQIEIRVAADKLASTTDLLSILATKLQARITAAQTAGTDVTALQATLSDMNTKIADAKTKAMAAIAGIAGLVPDNGVKTVMDSNNTALKAARDSIKAGTKDVKDAKKDADKIREGLKGDINRDTATSTATTTQ